VAAAAASGQCPPTWFPGGLEYPAFVRGGRIDAACRAGPDLVAAGTFSFSDATGTSSLNAARWDGASWHAMPGMLTSDPNGYPSVWTVHVYQGSVYAGGSFRVDAGDWQGLARWNGDSWQPLSPRLPGTVRALTEYNGRLIAAGLLFLPGVVSAASFDGTSWEPMPGVPGLATNLAVSGPDLYIAAFETYPAPGHVYRWTGSSWAPLLNTPGFITSLVSHQGSLVAAGEFTGPNNQLGVVRWDGAEWTWVSPSPGDPPGANVRCLASDGHTLFAGGFLPSIPATPFANALQDGTWTALDPLDGAATSWGAAVLGLFPDTSGVWALGTFETAAAQPSPSIARWGRGMPGCYPNCDCSTSTPTPSPADFACFMSRFAAKDPYANCDGSTLPPNVNDFVCFMNRFAAGCP
jgi:hypothetical protein